jgi:hypothetical protein
MGHRIGTRIVRGVTCAAVAGVAVAATAPGAVARKPAPPPKGGLRIHHTDLESSDGLFVFQNERRPFLAIEDTTVNTGTEPSSDSESAVYLVHGSRHWLLANRKVGRIRPGRRNSGTEHLVDVMDFPIGAYTAVACAGAQHGYAAAARNGRCIKGRTLDFFVAAKRWTGSVGGSLDSALGNIEQWSSSDTQLVYAVYEGKGVFTYRFTGTVTWKDSGTDQDGCTYSGTGSKTYTPQVQPTGSFSIDYKHEEYAGGFVEAAPLYPVTVSCPKANPFTTHGPVAPSIFASKLGTHTSLPFGSTALPGSPSVPAPGFEMHWNLAPAAP